MCGQVQHQDLLPGLPADRGEVPLHQVQRPAVAELLVVDLRVGVRSGARLAALGAVVVVAGDVQVQEAVVLSGNRADTDHVRVMGPVEVGEVTADEQVPVDRDHRPDLGVGGRAEAGHYALRLGVDFGDVAHGRAVHLGEGTADVGVRAVGAVEGNGVYLAVDVRYPFGDLVGRGRAEAEDVVPGVVVPLLADRG